MPVNRELDCSSTYHHPFDVFTSEAITIFWYENISSLLVLETSLETASEASLHRRDTGIIYCYVLLTYTITYFAMFMVEFVQLLHGCILILPA